MRPEEYHTSRLVELLEKERMLTWERIAQALGRPSRITVFRKLVRLGGRASYSHRGRYQTLDRIAAYNANGLWSFRGVRFSRPGTLLRTIVYRVEHSRQGYLASQLQALVQVRVHHALARLYGAQRLDREQLGDQYLSVSASSGRTNGRGVRQRSNRPRRGDHPASRRCPRSCVKASISCSRFSTKSSVVSTWDSSR